MFPLQIEADTLFPAVIVIIVLAVVFIIVILFALRRTRTMSDELSKEAKAKFDAIKPTTAPASTRNEEVLVKSFRPSSSIEPSETNASPNLLAELQDLKTRLRQISQDHAALKEVETTMRKELGSLRTEVNSLRDRLSEDANEIQKMKTSVEAHGKGFQALKQGIEQLEENQKQVERPVRLADATPAQQVEKPAILEPAAQPARTSQGGFLRGLFRHATCSNCGRPLKSQDRFCDSCGKAI